MNPRAIPLMAAIALIALPMTAAQARNMSNADRQLMIENITQADANNDGALSRSEFETLMKLNAADDLGRAARVVQSGRYGMAFNRMDANGDGFVTRQEMQALSEQASN